MAGGGRDKWRKISSTFRARALSRLSALSSAAWAYSTKNALMLPERREDSRKTCCCDKDASLLDRHETQTAFSALAATGF